MSEADRAKQHQEALTNWLRLSTGWLFIDAQPQRLGVAVSGGGDSMALLDLMLWQAKQGGFEVYAVTVDHGIRPEAARESLMVAEFCASKGISHHVLTWDWDGQGNLQGRAREARYQLIADWAERVGVDMVALGHTRNDQAETVLMRLARMSGVDGLAGMPHAFERHGLRWVRPLLRHQRSDLRQLLKYRNVPWMDDPSNEDTSFERVRARKVAHVLEGFGITDDTLVGISDQCLQAKWALEHYLVQEVQENGFVKEDHGDLVLPEGPSATQQVPSEIHRRARIAAVQWLTGAQYPPRSSTMLNLNVALAETDRFTFAGCMVTRQSGQNVRDSNLRFSREYNAVKGLVSSIDSLWDGRWALEGPHESDLEVRALGEAVSECPDWRDLGLPRTSLLSSPSVWRGNELISAPLAGISNGWTAKATGRGNFAEFLLSR